MVAAHIAARLPASARAGLDTRIITSPAAFRALEAPWTALLARMGASAEPFMAHGWLSAWVDGYLGPDSLQVVTHWREETLLMAWPLVLKRNSGLQLLEWMGTPVSQYGGVLVEPGPEASALLARGWEAIRGLQADLMHLRRTRADSPLAPLLAALGARAMNATAAPCCDFNSCPDFAAYEQRYSAKSRSNRRRQLRRLEEQGAVAFASHRPGPDAHALVQSAIVLKRQWLKASGRAGPALADPRFAAFFAKLAATPASPAGAQLVVTALHAGEALAAVTIALGLGPHLCLHIVAHDPRFSKSGAGGLVIEHTIRTALAAGYRTFDFLSPADAYKLEWSDRTVPVSDWAVPLSAIGTAYARVYLGAVRPRLKRLANAIASLKAA